MSPTVHSVRAREIRSRPPREWRHDVLERLAAGSRVLSLFGRRVAQDVTVYQASNLLGSMFRIEITARPSTDPPAQTLEKLKTLVDEELDKLREAPPDQREVQRVINQTEASFFSRMEYVGGQGGVADQLNGYGVQAGNPDWFAADLARYQSLQPGDIQAAVRRWLPPGRRIELIVVPKGAGK